MSEKSICQGAVVPGERVIPACNNKDMLELLTKSERELLVLILLELRMVKGAVHAILDSGVHCSGSPMRFAG